MNEESQIPDAELASAAFDGDVDAVERARVDASAALRDEVAFYGELRERLVDVSIPAGAREAGLAAALAAFDAGALIAGSSERRRGGTRSPRRLSRNERGPVSFRCITAASGNMRWLGGAAAAALVVVLGVGVVSTVGDSSDDSASESATTSVVVQKSADADDSNVASGSGDSPMLATEQAGQAEPADDTAEMAAAADAESAPEPSAGGDSSGGAGVPTSVASPPLEINSPAEVTPWVDAPRLGSGVEVVAFASSDEFLARSTPVATTAAAGDPPAATSAAPSAARDCSPTSSGLSAPAFYQDVQVYVVRDESADEVLVVDAASCAVVATFPLG